MSSLESAAETALREVKRWERERTWGGDRWGRGERERLGGGERGERGEGGGEWYRWGEEEWEREEEEKLEGIMHVGKAGVDEEDKEKEEEEEERRGKKTKRRRKIQRGRRGSLTPVASSRAAKFWYSPESLSLRPAVYSSSRISYTPAILVKLKYISNPDAPENKSYTMAC